jgi:hypothetical protein
MILKGLIQETKKLEEKILKYKLKHHFLLKY